MNPLLGVALILVLMYLVRKSFLGISLLAFPGTTLHEFCHWIVGKCTGAKPIEFSVIPRKMGSQYLLGFVRFSNLRWYNKPFVGLAPLILFPLTYVSWGLFWYAYGWDRWVVMYLMASLIFGAVPSMLDLKVAFSSPLTYLLLVSVLFYVFM